VVIWHFPPFWFWHNYQEKSGNPAMEAFQQHPQLSLGGERLFLRTFIGRKQTGDRGLDFD
jgi:hypothetical protein